eukprot:4065346-Pyramimonas_sp.AAC.1
MIKLRADMLESDSQGLGGYQGGAEAYSKYAAEDARKKRLAEDMWRARENNTLCEMYRFRV